MKKLLLILMIAMFAACSSVPFGFCAVAQAQDAAQRHPQLDRFEQSGGKVEFVGRSYGLDAWRLSKEDDVSYAYTTDEGGLVMGVMVTPSGDYETVKQIKEHQVSAPAPAPEKPASSKVEALYAEIEKASWIKAGADQAPPIYIFVNANCDHCQAFWRDLGNAVKGGLVQVRLVPYGKAEANRDGGAALLSVAEPSAAWNAYMNGDKSVLAKDKIADSAYAKLDANTALVDKWKLQGPPFTIYRKPGTSELIAVVGRPQNPMVVLADLMQQ